MHLATSSCPSFHRVHSDPITTRQPGIAASARVCSTLSRAHEASREPARSPTRQIDLQPSSFIVQHHIVYSSISDPLVLRVCARNIPVCIFGIVKWYGMEAGNCMSAYNPSRVLASVAPGSRTRHHIKQCGLDRSCIEIQTGGKVPTKNGPYRLAHILVQTWGFRMRSYAFCPHFTFRLFRHS